MRAVSVGVFLLASVVVVAQQRDFIVKQTTTLPSNEKRWALLVGVDQYEDEQISPLRGAANDASALRRVLIDHCGFPQNNIVVLASDQPEARKPKRGAIYQRLDNILRLVPKDGMFLFAFSGHGVEWENRAYLMPADAHLAASRRVLEDVAIDVQRLRTAIEERGVQQVLVFLDACRNDPGGRADATNPLRESFVNGLTFKLRNRDVQAFATLYATSVGDRSWEYIEKRQGYFTWFVAEGLKGQAANDRGEVTLQSLLNYVEDRVPRQVALDLGERGRQRPFAKVEGFKADQLVLSVAPRAVTVIGNDVQYWSSVERMNTCEAYEAYLGQYPSGSFASLAQMKVKTCREPAPKPVESDSKREEISAIPPPATVSGPNPGEDRVNAKDGLKYVWVPQGTFTMGCSPDDTKCEKDEKPRHPVKITKGFWLGQTELTQEAYERVTGKNPSHFKGADLPVERITWFEANEYCLAIGGRLPTEAEWEYAARAGIGLARYGDLDRIAWYGDNSNKNTHAVGQKAPNGWNLHDMLGNVWEWTRNWYGEKYYNERKGVDPQGPASGKIRVLRGGSWSDFPSFVRASFRFRLEPTYRFDFIGVRCIQD